MRLKKDLKIEIQVSPWEVFHDNFHEQYTITKKISCFSPQNISKAKPVIKKMRSPHEKIKQLLMVFEKPKDSIKEQLSFTPKYDNNSIHKKLKERLNAAILKQEKKEGNENKEQEKIKRLRSEKDIGSLKQSPQQSAQNYRQQLFTNLRSRKKRIVNRLETCDNQIMFMRKEIMHPIKSNDKLKSNKELILPKIRLCTIS